MEANPKFNPFEEIANRLSRIEEKLSLISLREQQTEKRFYPVSEAAKKLNVSSITIYRGCENGKIPNKRVGQRLLIPGSFVDR